jgi:uncharacterized membrane protein
MRWILFTIVLFILTPVSAATINSWDTEVLLRNDLSADMKITLNYADKVKQSDYFIAGSVTNVQVFGDNKLINCDITEQEIGTLIICDNIENKVIEYNFNVRGLVRKFRGLAMFQNKFPVLEITDKFSVIIKLPESSVIANEKDLQGTGFKPVEPEGLKGSDGRHIFVRWYLEKAKLGQTLDITLIYEEVEFDTTVVTIAVIILILIIFIWFVYNKKRSEKEILAVLTEEEKKIMEILMKSKKPVDQKYLVKELDLSKSKVSRLIKDMEKRKVIKKTVHGRSNKIETIKK